ncbi:PREDICTED: RNA-binding protein 42 [Papilio xuthus]|uniref:RNA-binding protein 42 n=1 Tax=Papilio xuthus TaxID=66420 RepID=A0A194PVM9_PAPXU|nr:PREDICTED: RNA-binding protein 42 [Papilio xuthus]KPI96819.1 RNA-binding protein 42 [Papilio xuthus]
MDDSNKFQQMQDEMSRFEAEISGSEIAANPRAVISSSTFGAAQQRLERVPPPPPPPALLPPPFESGVIDPGMMGTGLMYPGVPQPTPSSLMVPASVQRLRPSGPSDPYPGPMPFLRPGLPGPQLIPPPPPKPQPVVLSAAPKLYKQNKDDDDKKEKEGKKRKREPSPVVEVVVPREPTPPPAPAPPPPQDTAPKLKKEKKHRKVIRTAGGQVWEDVTLLDWPDDDFRMFCGDLGNDVTDELLTRTFSKYTSFQRAKVIRDKRTNKSKGFGFVSFKDPGDFIKAMKEMDGRYVGSRPIKLRKSTWRSRALDVVRRKEKEKAALLSLLMAGNKAAQH